MTSVSGDPHLRAIALVDAQRYELAIPLLRDALATRPDDATLLNNLSLCLLETDEPAEALKLASRATAIDPSHAWSHRLRAHSLCRLDRHKPALHAAQEAQRLRPGAWTSHTTVAQVQLMLGQTSEAELSARTAVELAPSVGDPYLTLASVQLECGKVAEARASTECALRLDPNSARARNVLGIVDRAAKFDRLATKHFLAAANSDVRASDARVNLIESTLRGGIDETVFWRMLLRPLAIGASFGAFGVIGLAVAIAVVAAVQWQRVESRLRRLPPATSAYVRSHRWDRWHPAQLRRTLSPRQGLATVTNPRLRRRAGAYIAAQLFIAAMFVCGWAAAYAALHPDSL